MFENCVIPVLHYGAGVWGLQAHTCTQNVQNRAMRFYLGTHKLTPTLGMSGDLGWHSLYIFRQIDAIRLWNRFINMSNSRVNRKVFMWDYHQCSSNWSSEIKKMLYELDMEEVFDDMHLCPISDLSATLKGDSENSWKDKVKNKTKLRTYITFKNKFGLENYLKVNLDRTERSLLAQLRLGILPLHIETGRFNGTPEIERKCKLCNQDTIENEMHFLLKCSKYQQERETLFRKATEVKLDFQNLLDCEKMYVLINDLCRQTAKFVKNAYFKRFFSINKN